VVVVEPVGELGQRAEVQIGRRQHVWPGLVAAVDPTGAHPDARGAGDVEQGIVADVQHLMRLHAQARAGGVEDRRVGLGVPGFACRDVRREAVGNSDAGEVGVAVGQRRQRPARGQAVQRGQRVGVELDAVARGVEGDEGGLGMRFVVACAGRARERACAGG
jgi:hypothetical protein